MKKQIKYGIFMTYSMGIIQVAANVIFTALLIRTLGNVEYGLYLLMGSLAANISIFDFGLNNTISRYVAKYRAEGDKEKESSLMFVSMAMYFGIALLVILAGVLIGIRLDYFVTDVTKAEMQLAYKMFFLLIVNVAITLPMNSFAAVLVGYEEFVYTRSISIMRVILMPLLSVPFLVYGRGSLPVVMITTITNVMAGLANAVYVIFKYKIRFHLYHPDLSFVKEILLYSGYIFLGVIADQLFYNTGNVVLGVVRGPKEVSVFGTAAQLNTYLISVIAAFTGVFLPSATMLVVKKPDRIELTAFFLKISRIVVILVFIIVGGFFCLGQEFIYYWLGPGYTDVYGISCIVLTGTAFMLIKAAGLSILQAKNLHGFRAKLLLAAAVVNFGLSFVLAGQWGYFGTAFSYSLTLVTANIILDFYYNKNVNLDMFAFYKLVFRMMLSTAAAAAVVFLVSGYLPYSILNFLLRGILYVILFAVFVYCFCLNKAERSRLHARRVKRV